MQSNSSKHLKHYLSDQKIGESTQGWPRIAFSVARHEASLVADKTAEGKALESMGDDRDEVGCDVTGDL